MLNWLYSRDSTVIQFFLVTAAIKEGAHIDQLKIRIDNPDNSVSARRQLDIWRAFLSKNTVLPSSRRAQIDRWTEIVENSELPAESSKELLLDLQFNLHRASDDSFEISVFHLAECIFVHCTESRSLRIITGASYAVSLIMIAILFFGFTGKFTVMSWTIVYLVFASIVMFNYYQVVFSFLAIAICEFSRTTECMIFLSSLIRLSNLSTEVDISFMDYSSNVPAKLSKQGDLVLQILNRVQQKSDRRVYRRIAEYVRSSTITSPQELSFKKTETQLNKSNDAEIRKRSSSKVRSLLNIPWNFDEVVLNSSDEENNDHLDKGSAELTGDSQNQFKSVTEPGIERKSIGRSQKSRLTRKSVTGDMIEEVPRLSLKYMENIDAWCWTQFLFLNFNDRMGARLTIFTYLCAIANIILMLTALLIIFSRSGAERLVAFEEPIFRQALVAITIFSVYLILSFYFAANINFELSQQRYFLVVCRSFVK